MPSRTNLRIEPATERDIPIILEFVRDLAIYEDHLEYFHATEERIRAGVFGPNAKARALIAYVDDVAAGVAVFYYTFSTFSGLPGLYLEDLFVRPEMRGHGVGKALLSALAFRAQEEGCYRIEWAVLHWNESAIRFYKNLGAEQINEWSVYRVSGEAMDRLAAGE